MASIDEPRFLREMMERESSDPGSPAQSTVEWQTRQPGAPGYGKPPSTHIPENLMIAPLAEDAPRHDERTSLETR